MKLTPMDIRNQDFKRVLRGYDPVEVNTFLEMLASEVEKLIRDQKENRGRAKELEEQLNNYKQLEKSLQQALLQAQESANQAREQSKREAGIIIKQAETSADEIVQDARSSLSRIKNEIEELRTIRETMISRLKILFNSQLELLHSLGAERDNDEDEEKTVTVGRKSVDVNDIIEKMDQDTE